MDKAAIVKEWLTFANKDINSAKYLLAMRPIPLEIICYHCEQAAEKALKRLSNSTRCGTASNA